MRISDWSSDVCSSDLKLTLSELLKTHIFRETINGKYISTDADEGSYDRSTGEILGPAAQAARGTLERIRSDEHTSELQSLMRISYAVFCLKKKTTKLTHMCNTQLHNDDTHQRHSHRPY